MSLDPRHDDADLAALLQQALRAETPAGLSDAQRAALLTAATRPATPPRWRRALTLAIACALPLWLIVHYPNDRDAQRHAQNGAQAWQARRASEARLAEVVTRLEQRIHKVEQLLAAERSARAEAEARAAAACASQESPRATGAAASARAARPKAARPAKASASKPASRAGGGGGCDPDDALCGL